MRSSSAYQLGLLKSNKATKPLLEALLDPYPDVRMTVVLALAEINDKASAQELLRRLKKEKHVDVQIKLTLAVGQMQIKEAIPILEKRINFPNNFIRDATIETLGDLGDKKVMPALLKMLKNKAEDKQIRRVICFYLGKLGDTSVLPVLKKIANDKDEDRIAIRGAAEQAIAQIKKRYKIKH